MSRTNLDNIKTYHQLDLNDEYEVLSKFGRYFEKGYHDAQINLLPIELSNMESFIICTDGHSKHLADFAYSLAPFFIKVPFEIFSSFRLPTYANETTLVLLLSKHIHSEELNSIEKEIDLKKTPCIRSLAGNEYQNLPHTLGFMFGLFSRLNPSFSKSLNPEDLFLLIEKTVNKLNREVEEKLNPAKQLAQKHSQKAIFFLSSGHLIGVCALASGLVVRWAKSFSGTYQLPEANGFFDDLFTYPTKVLNDYQLLVLNTDLYPQVISLQLEKAKTTLAKKRINYSLIKPDSNDWFGQIFESLVFLTFFSYYLSIVNKVKN